jgi:hypothetical protein
MKKTIFAALLVMSVNGAAGSYGAAPRFEKVSDHCYYLRPDAGGENVGAIVTDEGVLIIDPPQESELPIALDALKRVSQKPVRWVVFTNPRSARSTGARALAEQGAMLLGGARLHGLSQQTVPGTGPQKADAPSPLPWLVFDRQMRLYPSRLEIRITALGPKARTGGDAVVFVPLEKVLFTGPFYETARYPDIEADAQGSAAGWVDGLKEVVDSIPLLKPAIPARKPAAAVKEEPEKTLE